MPPLVLVLTGPTATGKTAVGVRLAKRLNGEVVSADSMQIYRDLTIGTAKPLPEEMDGVPHHMVDCVSPFENYSAARYAEEAAACCDDILSRGKLPILVGGTGLYLEALLTGRDYAPQGDPALRARLDREFEETGAQAMLKRLAEVDPDSAGRLHPNDRRRIVRALEIYLCSGITMTEHDRLSRLQPPRYESLRFALTFADREQLYSRINLRVDRMLQAGLLEEVRELLNTGLSPCHTALQAIGYKELVSHLLEGGDLNLAVEQIKQESRRYAKRQLSWLRRDSGIHWLVWEGSPDPEAAAADIEAYYHRHRKETPCVEAI